MEDDFGQLDHDFESVFDNVIYVRSHSVFRLLDLPPELVIRICQLAVIRPNTIDTTMSPKARRQARLLQQPALTRTCRLLRQEAPRSFYRDNTWEAYHWSKHNCIRDWLRAIGEDNLRTMRELTFHCKFQPDFWELKFNECGIKTKVEVAEDQTKAPNRRHSLNIRFL